MEGYTDNSQILNYNFPPFLLSYMWIILIPTILQKCLFDGTLFLENTIFNCYHIYLQHFP